MTGCLDVLNSLRNEMEITPESVRELAGLFESEMQKGFTNEAGSLKMLPAYLESPDGNEKGTYLALDFGGTNVRVYLVNLAGRGKFSIKKRLSFPLKDEKEGYDFTCRTAECTELFRFIARQIKKLASNDREYSLGHTFSFPCRADGLNHAALLNWTKEIETSGAEGRDIAGILAAALKDEGVFNVIPRAIINDTVGALLTGAYQDKNCDIGSIIGTGHNTCYLERNFTPNGKTMIINMEAGNFNKAPFSRYDLILDAGSEKPGAQLLEKMVSGKYLGELARLVLTSLSKEGLIFKGCKTEGLSCEYVLTSGDVGSILNDMSGDLLVVDNLLLHQFGIRGSSYPDRQAVREICRIIVSRSACLVAGTYLGILNHIDPGLRQLHTIAVDGSLYEKMPGYAKTVEMMLKSVLGDKHGQVSLRLTKDGSGVGAAVAAAMS